MYFDALVERIRATGANPVGASPGEIQALEKALGTRLPTAYQEFLGVFGRDHTGLWVGSDIFLENITNNRAVCRQLLVDNELDPAMIEDAVVWFTHQGYIASWFHPGEAPDPPVLLFNEATPERGVHSPGTFTQLVHADANDLLV